MKSRLLLITPRLYGIERKIKSGIEELGFDVVWIENKVLSLDYHAVNGKMRMIREVYCFIFSPQVWYLKKKLKKIGDKRFDILFCINGHVVCSYLLKKLKKENPGLFSLIYLWDSFSMYSWIKELRCFDKVYTFDPIDAINHDLEYKPNFNFCAGIIENKGSDIDVFFVGKFSPFRYFFLEKLLPQLINFNINYYIKVIAKDRNFLHNFLLYKIFKFLNLKGKWTEYYIMNYEAIEGIAKKDYIINNTIDFEETQSNFLGSDVIMDLSYPLQSGYSHRFISALGSGKKVITYNEYIRNELFYNPDQIYIIENGTENIDINWLKEKKSFAPVIEFSNLNISAWLTSLLYVENS